MNTNQGFNLVSRELERLLAEERAYHERRAREIQGLQHKLALTSLGKGPVKENADSPCAVRVAIANGKRLSPESIAALNEDDFDVILDMTTGQLKYRTDPAEHADFAASDLDGVGVHRIQILFFLFEHPGWLLSWDNLPDYCHSDDQPASPEAFTKSISVLRKALGTPGRSNPYIIDRPAWALSTRKRARAYTANPERKYLVIRWANKKSL